MSSHPTQSATDRLLGLSQSFRCLLGHDRWHLQRPGSLDEKRRPTNHPVAFVNGIEKWALKVDDNEGVGFCATPGGHAKSIQPPGSCLESHVVRDFALELVAGFDVDFLARNKHTAHQTDRPEDKQAGPGS